MKPFPIADDAAVITSTYVTRDGMPILYVSREEDDGEESWQFHCGNGDYSMERMQLVRLGTVLRIDPTVHDVADLPVGHCATRAAVGAPWTIAVDG